MLSLFIINFLKVALIHLLAVMSPGPDFVLISKNALTYSRRTGIYSAVGLGLGILVHVTYSLIGIGFVISQSIILFSVIKLLGAGYLIYIGINALRSKPQPLSTNITASSNPKELSVFGAIRMGFLTNALNPKATLFFLGLFTQVIDPTTPIWVQMVYGLEMSIMTIVWFSLVALFFSHEKVRGRFAKVSHHVDRVLGAVLIALGVKIALFSKGT
ncbi:MAG: LysE family transporter [Patescibacteria group bacterium]